MIKGVGLNMTREEALEILGLEPNAPLHEARSAYRRLSKFYHPDKNGAPNAAAMFRIINEAWEFIEEEIAKEAVQRKVERKKAEAEAAREHAEAAHQRAKEAERAAKEAEYAAEANQQEVEVEDKKSTSYIGWFVFLLIFGIGRSLISGESWDIVLIVRIILVSVIGAGILTGIAKLYKWIKNKLF